MDDNKTKVSIAYTNEQKELLNKLTDFMLEYNKNVNLTRITDEKEIWIKHYDDSVYPLFLADIKNGARVIDVGTGAGFPGVPWAILRPDFKITLLDSLKKRTVYLEKLTEHLNLNTLKIIHSRSEELAYNPKHREMYDIAISRAVSNLQSLNEYCLPFVKVGGYFLAMKGVEDEVNSSLNAIKLLGGEVERIISYEHETGDKRNLVVIKKISQTPIKYPRKQTNISKKPL